MPRSTEVWRSAERPAFDGPALIDTHIWLWYLDGEPGQMCADAIGMLRRCVRGEGLLVSDMSVWEVGNKAAKEKLSVAPNVSAWVQRATRRPGFSFLPLDRDILLAGTQLPGEVHGDPVDRMLVAAATLAGIPLVTADRLIMEYAANQGGLSVCDVRG